MNPIELADRYLGEYKIKNEEINSRNCPFCGPNQKKDNQYKFFLNRKEGTYKCHRENTCGAKGSFKNLMEHFGVLEDSQIHKRNIKKEYKPIKIQTTNLSDNTEKYIITRKISKEVINEHDIKEKDGNIAFEYYQKGQLVLVKYRTASKDKKYWQEGGGKPVLWEIDKIDKNKPLIITEGEFDKLALHQAGLKNVVSVPFGSNNLDWIEHCWDILEAINSVIIWPDNDDAGIRMKDEIIKRLGEWRCKVVDSKYKDVNVHLYKEGEQSVKQAVLSAEEIPIKRVLQLDEIEEFDPSKIESIKSNIPLLNKYLGGYMMGMITVWTGSNGSGKSTFISQEIVNAISQGKPSCLVTGELPHWLTRYWIELQSAGPEYIDNKWDNVREELSFFVPQKYKERIRRWAKNQLFIYDSFDSLKVKDILETFTAVARRYNVKQFIVDNLMIVNYDCNSHEKYNKQSEFIARMKDFAKKYSVHVHIVAHPRKPMGPVVTKEDIAGLYEITNLADNVIAVHRLNNKKRQALGITDQTADNALSIFKCRIYGQQDIIVALGFDKTCKRFSQLSVGDYDKKYGWEGDNNLE